MPICKQLKNHKLVLDTHIWIWLLNGEKIFNKIFLDEIKKRTNQGTIYLAAISLWEVSMLVEKRKIELEIDCLDWINQSLEGGEFKILALSPEVAVQSCRLGENIHGDPADRMIIASASASNAVLITHDRKILQYGESATLLVYDPIPS